MNKHHTFFRELYQEAIYYALKTHPRTTLGEFLLDVVFHTDKYDMSIFYLADYHCRLDIDTSTIILKEKRRPLRTPLTPIRTWGVQRWVSPP